MTQLGAVPWPDAPRRTAAGEGAFAAPRLPSLRFWLGVFLVLMFSGGWIIFVIGPTGNPQVGSLVMALFAPAYAVTLYMVASRWRRAIRSVLASPLAWALMALVGASILWSINPDVTMRRWVAVSFTTLAGTALAVSFDWDELSEVIGASYAVLILACIALAVALPSWGRMTTEFPGYWKGLWGEKNALGGHMVKGFCLLIAAAALNPRRWWLWSGFAGLAIFLVLMSGSKTSLVTALLGAGMLGFVFLVRRGGPASVLAVFGAVTAIAALVFVAVFAREQVFKVLGKDATLTGRTAIWSAAELEMAKNPLLGYGYQAVWATDDRWTPYAWIQKHANFKPQHAHNGWVETALGLGRVGLVVWGAVFLEFWARTAWAVFSSRGAWLALPFLIAYSVQSLTESTAYIYNDFTWVIFVALMTRLALPRPADDTAVDGRRAAEAAPAP